MQSSGSGVLWNDVQLRISVLMVALGYRKLRFIDAVRVGASEDFADHTISQEAGTGSTDSINFGMTANAPKRTIARL